MAPRQDQSRGLESRLQPLIHSELEWEFWFAIWLEWNTTHIYGSYIPLDFLSIKDPKKIKKGQNNFWRPKSKSKTQNFIKFFPWFGSFGVNLIGKAINLSLKAIKVRVESYVGQTGNLVSWIQFFLVWLFQYQQGKI